MIFTLNRNKNNRNQIIFCVLYAVFFLTLKSPVVFCYVTQHQKRYRYRSLKQDSSFFRANEATVRTSISTTVPILFSTASSSTSNNLEREEVATTESIVETCIQCWNNRDIEGTLACFAEDCRCEDTALSGPPVSDKAALRKRLQRSIDLLPRDCRIVLDDVANSPQDGKIGVRWHLETTTRGDANRPLPLSRGASFYTLHKESGLIETSFQVMETPVKPDDLVFDALAVPFRIVEGLTGDNAKTNKEPSQADLDSMSIIEKFYDGWNRRDIESSLQYAAEDIQYEDLLYVRPFSGKQALGEHLEKVTKQLPSVCRIIIDDQAMDPSNGNVGVLWHLEVENGQFLQGWSRGCSMYKTDLETGLITSGFDVTESPLKADERVLDLLLSPIQSLQSF